MSAREKNFFIAPVRRAEAGEELAAIYERIAGSGREVAHILSVTGQNPRARRRATRWRRRSLSMHGN